MASYVKRHIRKSQSERRQEILDATMHLISEHGVEGATVARIAKAVGVTPGALYRHFDSRAALLSETHQLANQRSVDLVQSSAGATVIERLEQVCSEHLGWASDNFNSIVRPFFMELASRPDPEVPDRLSPTRFSSFRAIVEMAEEGKLNGEIREDVEPEDLAWAVHMYFWTQDLAVMSGEANEASLAALHRNFMRMLDACRADGRKEEPTES